MDVQPLVANSELPSKLAPACSRLQVLKSYLAGLTTSLGAQSLAALTAEGRALGTRSLEPMVVPTEIEA